MIKKIKAFRPLEPYSKTIPYPPPPPHPPPWYLAWMPALRGTPHKNRDVLDSIRLSHRTDSQVSIRRWIGSLSVYGPKWAKLGPNGPKLGPNGPKWVQLGPKGPKLAEIGPKWAQMCKGAELETSRIRNECSVRAFVQQTCVLVEQAHTWSSCTRTHVDLLDICVFV